MYTEHITNASTYNTKGESPRGTLQKSQAINRTAFDKYISLTIKYTQSFYWQRQTTTSERVELSRATGDGAGRSYHGGILNGPVPVPVNRT